MLNEPTLDKLKHLGLYAMATAREAQQKDPSLGQIAFDERLDLLVDAECFDHKNKRLARLLREAKLKISQAKNKNNNNAAQQKLDKAVVRQLATCRWVQE